MLLSASATTFSRQAGDSTCGCTGPNPPIVQDRVLTLLEPCVLEKLESGKEEWQRARAVVFARAVPIRHGRRKRAHHHHILRHGSNQVSHRLRERVNDYGAHRPGILPDLQTKIEERADNADRGDQLRPGIDCFQTHIVSLANDRQGAEVKSGLAGGSPSLN